MVDSRRFHWRRLARARFSVPQFLAAYRSSRRQAPRVERILAVGRAFLAISGLTAIYLDPTEPARFAGLMYALLTSYAVYSVVVLAVIRRNVRLGLHLSIALHGIDILWASALTFFSQGPVSPFFLYFLFVSLAAAYRRGFRETMATTVVTVVVRAAGRCRGRRGALAHAWATESVINPIIIRTAYLLLTGFLLGYLAAQELTDTFDRRAR